jgi:hypothetical protein
MGQMVQTSLVSVSLARRIDQGQVHRSPRIQKIRFQLDSDLFSKSGSDKTSSGNGISVANHFNGFFCRYDFSSLHPCGRGRGEHGVGNFFHKNLLPGAITNWKKGFNPS